MGPLMTALILKAVENSSLKEAISRDGVDLDHISEEDLERELENAPLLVKAQAAPSTAGGVIRTAYNAATKAGGALGGASSAASASQHVVHTAVAGTAMAAAAVAAPALGAVKLAKLIAQVIRFWKTQKHVNQLVIIYFMALDAGESDEVLLDAMVYAMQQKKVKLDRNGIASVIPGLVELENTYHGITKLLNGVTGLKREEQAAVLYRYAYVSGNVWAKRTVAELLGGMPGKGLDDTPNLAGAEVDVFAVATSSDDPVMDAANQDDDVGGNDEDPQGAAVAVPKKGLIQRFTALFAGKSKGYASLSQTHGIQSEITNKIANKLKSS